MRRILELEATCERLEDERAWLERECQDLREHLAGARERTRQDRALILSQSEERRALETMLSSIFSSRTWRLGAPLRTAMAYLRRLVGASELTSNGTGQAEHIDLPSKAVLFVSGCPGDAKRYRCDHVAEQLEALGISTHVAVQSEVKLDEAVHRFAIFILHRLAHDHEVETFIRKARAAGRPVLFDTDDWVFDLEAARYVAALEDMSTRDRALYRQGLLRYRETLSLCDAVLVSTGHLAELALPLGKPVHVLANVVSREMVERASTARSITREKKPPTGKDGSVTLAYFSGTPTHKRDFAEAADAIEWTMETHPRVRLLTVGHIDVSDRFARFGNRFEHLPLMPWQQLSEVMARIDVNLAPLERSNHFTASKSCVKFLEAAMVGIPTIATPLPDFCRVIDHGQNGLLADNPEEWRQGLQALVESAELREKLGARAREDLFRQHTTSAHAPRVLAALKSAGAARRADAPLTINWIVRAPIAGTGGGYWTIFRLANHLGAAGHRVRVYVEAIAHLEGRSRQEIEQFLETNFGPLHVEPIIGHANILPADVSIATNWPTAYTVAQQPDALFRFYFVQDFEPEFYSARDPLYREAELTYQLPLQHVCIGRSLAARISRLTGRSAECIDFAVDTAVFRTTRPPVERTGPVKVLFFARPGLKRRGFDLGLAALEELVRRRPGVEVSFFGASDDEIRGVRFPFKNLGILTHEELARAMNDTNILLSFSLSANVSWVPLQGMACGCAVVEANVPGVREMVDDGETCLLAEQTPHSVADALTRLVDDAELRCGIATKASSVLAARTWEGSARQFERLLLDRCIARIAPATPQADSSEPLVRFPGRLAHSRPQTSS